MDEETITLIEQWGFPELIEEFRRNQVDFELMKRLSSELIKEMIPNVVLRLEFKNKWQTHFEMSNNAEDSSSTCDPLKVDSNQLNNERVIDVVNENNPPELERQHPFIGNLLFSLSILDIIRNNHRAAAYYKSYQETNVLSTKARNLLVDIIITAAVSLKSKLKPIDFSILIEKFLKIQLHQCSRFIRDEGFIHRLTTGPKNLINLSDLDDFVNLDTFFQDNKKDLSIYSSWVNINGTEYKIDSVIKIKSNKILPDFYRIKHIILDKSQQVFFLSLKLHTKKFVNHLQAFEVEELKESELIAYSDLKIYTCYLTHLLFKNKLYILND